MTSIRVRSGGGAHRMVRGNVPLRRGEHTLDLQTPSPFTLALSDGTKLPTQCDVVARYDDLTASIVQLRAQLPEGSPEGEYVLDVLDEAQPTGGPDLSEWDPDVLQLALAKYGAVLIVEDYFGNHYFASLTRDLKGMIAGGRTVKFDCFGPNTIRSEIPEYMLPTPPGLYPSTAEQLHHAGMVHTRMTTHRGSGVMELDFKWANASADKPIGTFQFRSLSILLPPNFNYRSRIPLAQSGPSGDDDFGFDAHYLVAPNSDGRMHVLHQNQHMRFRLLVFEHDAQAEADAMLAHSGWGTTTAWGKDGRLGFGISGFPIADYSHFSDPDWWSRRNGEKIRQAVETGQPHSDAQSNSLGGDGNVGPYWMSGGSYGGQTSGTGKEFFAGMAEVATGHAGGLDYFQLLAHGWMNRMDDGCIWAADCRPPHETVEKLRNLPSNQRWRYFDGWQKKSWPNGDDNQDAPFGYDAVQSLGGLGSGEAPYAQVVPAVARASYFWRKVFDGKFSTSGYMRNDAQHLVRTTCANEALIYLDNDALARHDAEEIAFCGRLMYLDGADGRLTKIANPSVDAVGGDLGRGPSHVAQAWALYWHVADPESRVWLDRCLDLYLQAHERNLHKAGAAYTAKGGKVLTGFDPDAKYACLRPNEVAYGVMALEAIREAFPGRAARALTVLETTLNVGVFTHSWQKDQQGNLKGSCWNIVGVAPLAASFGDPDGFFDPGEHPPEQYGMSADSFGVNLCLAVGLKLGLPLAEDRAKRMYGSNPLAGVKAKGWEWLAWVRAGVLAQLQNPAS